MKMSTLQHYKTKYFIKLKKHFLIILFFVLSISEVLAQHQELSELPNTWKPQSKTKTSEIHSILQAFQHSTVSGHFRYFFMTTNNEEPYTDYFANAVGGGLKFETAPFHHFQAGISGFYIFNIGSSDFAKADPVTKQSSRYEIALFDIEDPNNKSNMDRLEELYLSYHFNNAKLTFGKQMINTPFINLQDGRMRPTGVEGLWGTMNTPKKIKLEGGYLYRISPRSTLSYYDIGKSMGIYPSGVNMDGSKSNYKDHIESKGVLIAGITSQTLKHTKLQVWNQFVENVFNTTLVQADYLMDKKNGHQIDIGVQSIVQLPVHQGGHEEINKTYFSPQAHSFTYGAKVGWHHRQFETSLNYNRITSAGRYLMPREWGREPFYTFMPRERNEGLGDVHAFSLKLNYTIPSLRLKANTGIGYYDLPSVTNYKLNKYGMPSYAQFNFDLRYEFAGMLKGFDAQLLLVHKLNTSKETLESKHIFNKVNMTQVNAVLNFRY